MKRTLYGFLGLFLLVSCNGARDVDVSRQDETTTTDKYFVTQGSAEKIAAAFFDGSTPILLGSDATLSLRAGDDRPTTPSFYIYGGQDGGYVIISASEVAYPILGYSREGKIDMDNLPCGLKMVLGGYSDHINRARKLALDPAEKIKMLRTSLRAKEAVGKVVVAPLMAEIHWDQMPYYNALCPSPSSVPVGCVATATSQIMRYWAYPERAKGHHSYNSELFGVQSHDYNYNINWEAMPKALLKKPNYEVARLCYGVAVSIDMGFNYSYNGGSGAMQTSVPSALIRHYGYPKSVTNAKRHQYPDTNTWIALMKTELDNHRPIQYGGSGSGGGHSFVLDGYDDKNYFHVNWGWGGQSDGWFLLDALDPDDLGTGGGSGGFNRGQHAVIHFAPPMVVKGDNDKPIIEQGNDDKPNVPSVDYKEVWVLNTYELFIRYTKFNGVETNSSARGYEAFLNKKITTTVGGKVDYEIEPEVIAPSRIPAYLIAVDFNNDGRFDLAENSNELVVLEKPGNANTFTGSFMIPSSVGKGTYRMRVNIDDNAFRDPNKGHLTGEFEDYQLTIQ